MKPNRSLKRLAVTAIMAAAACVLGPISVPLPFSLVPISACTLVFYLFSYLLRARDCVAACIVYMLLGIVGLPVFSGFSGGLAKLAGPTGGYLIGFLFLTACSSAAAEKFPENRFLQVLGIVHPIG